MAQRMVMGVDLVEFAITPAVALAALALCMEIASFIFKRYCKVLAAVVQLGVEPPIPAAHSRKQESSAAGAKLHRDKTIASIRMPQAVSS